MLFQGDAPEGSDTFQWPVIERDRVGGLRLIIWDKEKVPLCQYRLMHRKKVTSELHDSYFRLMTITHSISKIQLAIVWALNYYLTQLSSSPRSSCQEGSRQLETRCSRESHTRPRGPSETPIELTPPSGGHERHNVAVITVGQDITVYVRSPAPSHTRKQWTTLSKLYWFGAKKNTPDISSWYGYGLGVHGDEHKVPRK